MANTFHLTIHFHDNVVPGAAEILGVSEARAQAWRSLEDYPYSNYVQVLDERNTVIETMERVKITD